MAKAKTKNRALTRLRRQQPGTDTIELLIADITGVLRGKRVRGNEVDDILDDGFTIPGGIVVLDTLGDCVPGIHWSSDDGDPDAFARVLPDTLAPVPWLSRPTGQALFRLFHDDDTPFFADPRHVLERAMAPLRRMKLNAVMACELEFYLLDGRVDRPEAHVPKVPGTDRPQPGPQVYHPDDLWDNEAFLDGVLDTCTAQGIPAGTTISEFAPGQFEVNLHHVDDPVQACDHAVLLKRAIKAVARQHDLIACFMAKPFEEQSGSGLHLHISLVDEQGRNYFSRDQGKAANPPFSARLRHAVGGLGKTMAECTAVFAPNANSYRRLRPDAFAPVEPNWGANHRNVAIRVPLSDAGNLRIEHRVAGADANPYLVAAAVLSGIHYGLKHKCDPGRMVAQGEFVALRRRIPNRWDAALDKTARSAVLKDYLGEAFVKTYVANRRHESQCFHNRISELDFDYYLRAV